MKRLVCLPLVLAPIGACGERSPQQDGARIAIDVAPLSLQSVSNARYRLTVVNADEQIVWTRDDITAQRYGDARGSVAFVGPCDATSNPHTVTVELLELWADGALVPADAWQNPGPVTQGDIACLPNADVPVTFNLTILRPATQGFFDIAVNFDDIFCSAKLDCVDALLHRPQDPDGDGPIQAGDRGPSTVVAFACTAGVEQDTTLYWGTTQVVCDEGTYPIDVGGPRGQNGPIALAEQRNPGIYEHALYRGAEDFPDLDKCYWNLAFGFDAERLGINCRFEAIATAASSPMGDLATQVGVKYPVIRWSVPLTDGNGRRICQEHALNQPDSGVATIYADGPALDFPTHAACGEDPIRGTPPIACTGAIPGGDVGVRTDPQGKVFLTHGGQEAGPFDLPAGLALATECCVDPCCESEVLR